MFLSGLGECAVDEEVVLGLGACFFVTETIVVLDVSTTWLTAAGFRLFVECIIGDGASRECVGDPGID